MENWLQIVGKFWGHYSALIEAFYKDHTGLVSLLVLVFTGAAAIFAYLGLVKPKKNAPESSPFLDPVLRLRLLDKVQSERVDPRLRQGLREAIRVDLGLTETPGAVQAKLQVYTRLESGTVAEQPIQGPIQHIFEQTAGGRLLILGEPGTGKTNLLLELAQSLIADAKHDETHPIPLVFSLPRWTLGTRGRTFGEWLRDDLAAEYGLSRAAADSLVQQDCILPLLDGLDEVSEGRRAACVDAIHAYQRDRNLGPLAVCCRITEYEGLRILELGTAVRVEKLTRGDVEREIAKPRMEYVRKALKSDPQLWEVIDTPLWLHVLFGAARVESPGGSQNKPPRERLYARFVEYALTREMDYSPRRRTAREPLLRWLGWLASELRRRDQAQFALEDLDFSWLASKRAKRAARWFVSLVFGQVVGLVNGLVGWLFGGLGLGLVFWLVGWLAVGLVSGLSGELVGWEAAEEICFAWQERMRGLGSGLFAGLVFGLVGGLSGCEAAEELYFAWQKIMRGLVVGLSGGHVGGLFVGLVGGLVTWLLGGLLVVLQPRAVSGRSVPNRGTLRSLRYALRIALLSLAVAFLVGGALQRLGSLDDRLRVAVASSAFAYAGLVLALEKGGRFALRHYSIHLSLWRLGLVPFRYVRFLNEATERLFLIRRGGSYEFFHLTFRDYMADTYNHNTNAAAKPKAGIK